MIARQPPYKAVKQKIASASHITLLTHLNPDADTLGTALGIYALIKAEERSKKIEVVNASKVLPRYLDFLPNFSKIKPCIEYNESLIISCDSGSVDRLGFDLENRDIINIDHHQSNTGYGSVNVVLPECASASQVAYTLFRGIMPLTAEAATCFYTALLSDTQYFTTSRVNAEVLGMAEELVVLGANPSKIAYHFTQRRSLGSFRILQTALESLTLHEEARVASLQVTKEQIAAAGATVADMDGVVDYAKSLATVEVALFAMELPEGIRISLRSKGVDVSKVAVVFGGGGHKVAAGFTLKHSKLQESIDTILKKIRALL